MAIIGESGSGKSTLLHALMGLLPHDGTVQYGDGWDRSGLGVVLPGMSLYTGTVRDNLASGGPIRLGAAMVAAWALGDEGVDENGGEIVVDDPLADELLLLAAAQKSGHETAFISHEGVFGDLATNERFRRTFVEELDALRREGARARLRALAGRTRAA